MKATKLRRPIGPVAVAGLLALLFIATAAIWATYALLIDTDSVVNTFVAGENEIEIEEFFSPPPELKPGTVIRKEPSVRNTGNLPVFVRVRADFTSSAAEDFCEPLDINLARGWTGKQADGYYYYEPILRPGQATPALFTTVKIKAGTTPAQIKDFDIIVYAESVQAGTYTAYNTGVWESLNNH